jgi:tRNA threonylcarbamoyladenosine biosynthesis protein TsaB
MTNYLLHLETATKVCSVALSLNGKVISLKESNEDQFIHGEALSSFILDVLSEANIELSQVVAVSISSGPGSYTGLRIGASTAKGLCFGLSIPLIAIPSLYSLIVIAKQKHPKSTIYALFDARRMEVFSQLVDENMTELKPVGPEILDELTGSTFEPFLAVGDGARKVSTLWQDRNVEFDDTILPSALGQIEMAYQKYKMGDFEDLASFVPNYGKEFHSI